MVGRYDYWLVLLSVIVAVTASYVSLDVGARMVAARGRRAASYWLAGGALALGTGIWAMHFVGMLGFRLPVPVSYDVWITLLSLALAIAGCALTFALLARGTLGAAKLALGGLLTGVVIVSMHYTGMAAMRMQPPIDYRASLVAASVLIAAAASALGLWSAFRLRLETVFTAFSKKAGSAFLVGTAVYGMHYTGMAAARFAPDSVCTVGALQINTAGLAISLGAFTLLCQAAVLLISAFDSYRAGRAVSRGQAAREEERLLIARNVHDELGQALTAAKIDLALIERNVASRGGPVAAADILPELASAKRTIERAVDSVRRITTDLRPPVLDQAGFAEAVDWLAHEFDTRTGIRTEVLRPGGLAEPDQERAIAMFRILQEALTNVARHARAGRVEIGIGEERGEHVLRVRDDGVGVPESKVRDPRSLGLVGMRERAEMLGGRVEIRRGPRGGTVVTALVPKGPPGPRGGRGAAW